MQEAVQMEPQIELARIIQYGQGDDSQNSLRSK